MDMNIPRKKASGKWVWIKDSETDVVDTQDGQSHDSLYELVSCVESASNKIQLKHSKAIQIKIHKFTWGQIFSKERCRKKKSPKSCSPQSNINSFNKGSCQSTRKKLSYNQHDHGIEVSNIILNISDEDEAENMTSKIPSVHPSDSSYCTKKQHMSDFKCTKVSTLCTPPKQMKKVSQKPIGRRTRLGIKIAMENSKNKKSTISTPSPSNKSATKSSTPTKHPNILVSLPSEIKCTFPPTRAMHLQMADIQLCAYVFNAEHDPNEVMIQIGGYTVSRMELHCMCPNEVVKDQIFNLMAMKTTWSQYNAVNKTVWSLPPTFAEDVKYGHNLESLATTYSTNFMSPFTTLKYIYVPSKDEGGHWFLMVISIKDKIVYHLDSFLQPQNIATRREIISKLCKVIAELVLTDKYPNNYLNGSTDFGDWEIKEPRGMPNNGSRDTTSIWVLDWLEMEHGFHTNLSTNFNEDVVRMWTAIILIRGPHNERRIYLEQKVQEYWNTLPLMEDNLH
ncbi:ubiquitin-specific protease ESD4 [Trifolium repens]|nr:ubiquitin-specific protease ESD4 [Trifolium repens]KAK2419569.1 ubiquitin-specific protease ESD4 [Trifolium repens]